MLSPSQRRQIVSNETRKALAAMTPNCPGNRYSGAQIARAKGLGRKRALEVLDAS